MMKHPLRLPTRVIVLARWMVIVAAASSTPILLAQTQSNRLVHVTVTDPLGRFVTNLEQERFEIVENGTRRPITGFSDVESPISLAIVSGSQVKIGDLNLGDVLIQTPALNNAIRQLSASTNLRKALIVTTAIDAQAIPFGIQIVQVKPDDLFRAVVELKQPRELPPLRPNLK